LAYQSLYRRRRPQTFSDMIGQEHITRTLGNALQHERLAHAYLFSGPRGTGKTTAAKIFARAMNCVEYPTIEPCGKCNSCKNIAAGVSIDVIEMDAASNRGIDEIRELRERTRFASGESRFKVYIIDEAHMLTPEACNAFLKTLEEPPRGVVFILATTDPSRLPSTIVSRCQRFDFHLLTAEQIRNRLDLIIEEEGWQAEDEALALISRLAEGSMRDALGILEQCSAYGDEAITAEHVRTVTGATRTEAIGALIGAAIDNDLDRGLTELHQVVYSGRDLNLFMRDLTYAFSRLLMAGGKAQEQVSEDHHEFAGLTGQYGGKIERSRLLDLIELLHEAGGDLRHAHFPQYILEITFIRLLRLLHGRLKPAEPLHVEEFAAAKPAVKATDTKKSGLPLAKAAVEADKKAAAGSEQDKADQTPAELSEPREEPLPMAKNWLLCGKPGRAFWVN
jgi:DNA polymerase III subunit gamma/tau